MFMGHGMAYWIELEKIARELDASKLLDEVVKLRGLVAYYESRLSEMAEVMGKR